MGVVVIAFTRLKTAQTVDFYFIGVLPVAHHWLQFLWLPFCRLQQSGCEATWRSNQQRWLKAWWPQHPIRSIVADVQSEGAVPLSDKEGDDEKLLLNQVWRKGFNWVTMFYCFPVWAFSFCLPQTCNYKWRDERRGNVFISVFMSNQRGAAGCPGAPHTVSMKICILYGVF